LFGELIIFVLMMKWLTCFFKYFLRLLLVKARTWLSKYPRLKVRILNLIRRHSNFEFWFRNILNIGYEPIRYKTSKTINPTSLFLSRRGAQIYQDLIAGIDLQRKIK
jgi:hypothetical protein